MTTDDISDRSVAAHTEREYRRQVTRVADHLRRYADRIEQAGMEYQRGLQPARHVMAAADMLHELNGMFGNLPTWQLIAAADDAQKAASS